MAQEDKNSFAAELLWFLGHKSRRRFDTLKNFVSSSARLTSTFSHRLNTYRFLSFKLNCYVRILTLKLML